VGKPGRYVDELGDLCRQAAVQFADDWRRIERYVTERVSQLPREEQEALRQDVLMMLRLQPPRRPRP
jgi:hypothetical protein